jgi:hypothetical protein
MIAKAKHHKRKKILQSTTKQFKSEKRTEERQNCLQHKFPGLNLSLRNNEIFLHTITIYGFGHPMRNLMIET